jgi:hypothetical protein
VQLPQPRFLATGLSIVQELVQPDRRVEHQQLVICWCYSEVHEWSAYRCCILVDSADRCSDAPGLLSAQQDCHCVCGGCRRLCHYHWSSADTSLATIVNAAPTPSIKRSLISLSVPCMPTKSTRSSGKTFMMASSSAFQRDRLPRSPFPRLTARPSTHGISCL